MFSNKIVTFVAIYPKQLFVVRCPTFLFSKLVRRLVEPSGNIDCEKCLALKYHLEGARERGGRAEQNSGPFEMVLNFEMRFEKK